MSQDKLIIIYTIIHSVILIGIIGAEIIKEKKIKLEFIVICMYIIFSVSIGLATFFYLLLYCAILQLFIKNYILIQVLLNIPIVLLTYKLLKKANKKL